METFKDIFEATKLLTTVDIPGPLASFIDKRFGKDIIIVDTGKEYQITLQHEKLDGSDLKNFTLNGLIGIEPGFKPRTLKVVLRK